MSELQTLRDRVAELEELIGIALPPASCRAVHLTRSETRVCGLLLKHSVVTKDYYLRAMFGGLPDCDQPNSDMLLPVYISKIRRKLRPFGIEIACRWGQGYFLDADNKAKLAAVLDDREISKQDP